VSKSTKLLYLRERKEKIPCGNEDCPFWSSEAATHCDDAEHGGDATSECTVYFPQPEKSNIFNAEQTVTIGTITSDSAFSLTELLLNKGFSMNVTTINSLWHIEAWK